MKKIMVFTVVAVMLLSVVLTGYAAAGEDGVFKAGLVTDVGSINDESFNQAGWEGMLKLQDELGYEVKYLESSQESDYGPNLDKLADEEMDIIWGMGFLIADAMKNAAMVNPDIKFGVVDSEYEEQPDNLASVLFKAEESSFLCGYLAAKTTETDHLGIICGMKNPIMDHFLYGFEAGVAVAEKEMGKDIQVDTQFTESFADDAKGKAIATLMYSEGVDIIYAIAGQSSLGIFEAAKEFDKYAIGADKDQNYLAPDNIISSAMKNITNVVYDVTVSIAEGDFQGGHGTYYGLAEDAVGIAPSTKDMIDAQVYADTEALRQQVIDGEYQVPVTEEELAEFEASLG